MSGSVDDNKIKLTRGDTGRFEVEITVDERIYQPTGGDVVRFALKRDKKTGVRYTEFADEEPLLLIVIPHDTMMLEIKPTDTKDLHFGKYAYDIEITFEDGTVDTFITDEEFMLTEEVD